MKKDITQEPEYQELLQMLKGMDPNRVALLDQCLSDMKQEEKNTEYYTTAQAAELLGITQAGLRLWVKNGKIEAKRVGSRWRINKQAVDAIVGKNK